MDLDDLEPRKKLPDIVLGQDISTFSAHELEKRIARLEEEIARCRVAIKERRPPSRRRKTFSRSDIWFIRLDINLNTHSKLGMCALSWVVYQA